MQEEKQQWLSIAAVVLVIGGLGYFLFRQSRQSEAPVEDQTTQVAEERANELVERMKFEVPEQADRATLSDVSGGSAAGLATKVEEEGRVEISVIAALPDSDPDQDYEAYLVGETEGDEVHLGKLTESKGGWILEYSSSSDLSGYNRVKVTKEETDDKVSETSLLEGEFNK